MLTFTVSPSLTFSRSASSRETVTYVSNRAVYRENGKSYVHMRDENGNVVSVEVVTGFSDGSYVEIIEGLSEGDTVLIESGVSDS